MPTTEEIEQQKAEADSQRHIDQVVEVRAEVERVHANLVEGATYGFGYTCHAYVMLCFARIDGISKFWAGGENKIDPNTAGKAQTKRMTAFLDQYYPRPTAPHPLAVELWRHTLMHEGIPRELEGPKGTHYRYQLVWQLDDPSRHYTLTEVSRKESGADYVYHAFHVAVLGLFADLEHMVRGYSADLCAPGNDHLRKNHADREVEMSQAATALASFTP